MFVLWLNGIVRAESKLPCLAKLEDFGAPAAADSCAPTPSCCVPHAIHAVYAVYAPPLTDAKHF